MPQVIPSTQQGLTLMELVLCCLLLGILMLSATPPLHEIRQAHDARRLRADYLALLSYARNSAIDRGTTLVLCPGAEGTLCEGPWRKGARLFSDADDNRQLDPTDELLRTLPAAPAGFSVRMNAFPTGRYLRFTPLGFTDGQSGNFTFCPEDGEATRAQQIVFTHNGRLRLARDNDGDGIVEDSEGEALDC